MTKHEVEEGLQVLDADFQTRAANRFWDRKWRRRHQRRSLLFYYYYYYDNPQPCNRGWRASICIVHVFFPPFVFHAFTYTKSYLLMLTFVFTGQKTTTVGSHLAHFRHSALHIGWGEGQWCLLARRRRWISFTNELSPRQIIPFGRNLKAQFGFVRPSKCVASSFSVYALRPVIVRRRSIQRNYLNWTIN